MFAYMARRRFLLMIVLALLATGCTTPLLRSTASATPVASPSIDQTPAPSVDAPSVDTPSVDTTGVTLPGVTSPGVTLPGVTSPGVTSPGATSPGATSPGADSPATRAPLTAADFAGLTTEEALHIAQPLPRDLADMALRLDPTLDDIPRLLNTTTPEHAVGDTLAFWVQNSSTAEFKQIVARLVYKTDVAYAWVEEGEPYNESALQSSIDTFSTSIYPAVRAVYGSEAMPGADNDPHVHILHTTGLGPGVAGYFLGGDEYSSQVLPHSNQKEMFYVSLDWLNNGAYGANYEGVLAHEFQHMIHHHHDATEQAWVNEGLSEMARETAGYAGFSSFPYAFAANSGTQLNDWGGANDNNWAHYGASYLFMHYLAQRFGDGILGEIVREPANGMAGIAAVLARAPYSTSVDAIYGDWAIANAVNDLTPDEKGMVRWGYPDMPLLQVGQSQPNNQYVLEVQGSPANFTNRTILLQDDGSGRARTVTFWGQSQTSIGAFTVEDGDRYWWSNRVDNSETRLTREFDLRTLAPGTPVTMTVRMAYDIESDYDFGYLMASRDGAAWEILPGQYTTNVNPSGMNLGNAYTGLAPESESPDLLTWVTDHFDLSAYAGDELWVRFVYITDDAVTNPGWALDAVSIPALHYTEDFAGDAEGWESEGWVLTDGLLAQLWLLQAVELVNGKIASVHTVPIAVTDGGAMAEWQTPNLAAETEILLIISPVTDGTTEPASFRIGVE